MRRSSKAFTLLELMIVVAIAGILAIAGGLMLSSRLQVARLESFAQTFADDLASARKIAILRGCPVRLIFCGDRNCSTADSMNLQQNAADRTIFAPRSSIPPAPTPPPGPVQSYSFWKMATELNTLNCFKGPPPYVADNRANWDLERRPQIVPTDIAFTDIYNVPALNAMQNDWSDGANVNAINSIYFSSQLGQLNVANTNEFYDAPTNTERIIVQIQPRGCNPQDPSDDCPAYQVIMNTGGTFLVRKCAPATAGTTRCRRKSS